MFDRAESVVSIEDTTYAKLILTQTLSIRLIKLCFVIGMQEEMTAPHAPEHVSTTATKSTTPAYASVKEKGMVFVDLDVGAHALPTTVEVDTAEKAVPAPQPSSAQNTHVKYIGRVLHRMPCQADLTPSSNSTQITSGCYVEMPWTYTTYLPNQPKFDDDLSATRLAAAIGISPQMHGACIVTHHNGSMYSHLKYATGLLTSCAWLRELIADTCCRLHSGTVHKLCPVGCIITDRADHRLGNMTTEQAQTLSAHVTALETQLTSLHWRAVQHGLLLIDLRSNDVGVLNGRLVVLDWSRVITFSLSKLCQQKGGALLLPLIKDMHDGLIRSAIQAVLLPNAGCW